MGSFEKDLGAVTAYAYAVENGYTGTEQEFAELMASYATVAQEAAASETAARGYAETAEDAKTAAEAASTTAISKASAAATSADTALTAASTATNAAATATNKSTEAVTAAATATEKAGEATTAATTATTKATEAAASATTATTAASEASASATAAAGSAIEASGYADDAQEAAEELSGTVDDVAILKKQIALKQLQLDCYPLEMLPQVVISKNKKCTGFNTETKVPGPLTDQDGQDVLTFSVADLITEGVTKIIFPKATDHGGVGQNTIVWTAGVRASNVVGYTDADGISTITLSSISTYDNILITLKHGYEWIKYTKDYSEDAIERGVTGWIRRDDFRANDIRDITIDIDARQIRTYTTTSNMVGETIEKGQLQDTNPITYKVSANDHLFLSIMRLEFLKTIKFYVNTRAYQWGSVIKLGSPVEYNLQSVTVSNIENGAYSFISFDSTTRLATVNVDTLKAAYPEAKKIYIVSDMSKQKPEVTLTNELYLSDFKWIAEYAKKLKGAELLMPKSIPGVVGIPTWVYFENILPNGWLKDYTITTERTSKNRREAHKSESAAAGTASINVYVYDGETIVNAKVMGLILKAKEASSTQSVKVLCIGDSKTEAAGKRVRINELVADDSYLSVTFLGTRGSDPTKSEGYSGKSVVDFCQSATLGTGVTNPFYDSSMEGDNKFNFAQYVTALGDAPDIVFIDHGANQTSKAWATVKSCYDAMIDSIHEYSESIKVVICIQEGSGLAKMANYTQGTKYAYGYGNSEANYSIPKMLAEYEGREEENIYICPQYLCVDLYRDFPLALLPVSENNSLREYLCLDNTHPGTNIGNWSSATAYKVYDYIRRNGVPYAAVKASTNVDPETDTTGEYWTKIVNPEAGYRKIGEMYYAVIKSLVS